MTTPPAGAAPRIVKTFLVLLVPVLVIVAFFAFGFATIRGESEVAMHFMTGEDFERLHIRCIFIGIGAVLLDLFLVWHLWRRRSQENETHVAEPRTGAKLRPSRFRRSRTAARHV